MIKLVNGMLNGLSSRLSAAMFSSVDTLNSLNSIPLAFALSPGYREIYKYHRILLHGLALGGDLAKISLKDVAELYEYWCFIKLNSILKERYELKRQDVIKVNSSGLYITLRSGKSSKVVYSNKLNEELVLEYCTISA